MQSLNPLECLEWSLGKTTPFNIVVEVQGQGRMDNDRLHQAAKKLLEAHTQLQKGVNVYMGEFCFQKVNLGVLPFFAVEDFSVEKALNTAFDKGSYLWNLYLVQKENRFSIYLTIHHVLSDGVSAVELMKELLTYYEDPSALIDTDDSIHFYQRLNGVRNVDGVPGFPSRCLENEKLNGITSFKTFTFNRASHFTTRCKEKGVGIQASLLALALKATQQTSLNQDLPLLLQSHNLVDMRNRVNPAVPKNTLRCIISQLVITLERDSERSFWDMAKYYSERIGQMLQEGFAEKTLEEVNKALLDNTDTSVFVPFVKEPALCITNMGRTSLFNSQFLQITNAQLFVTTHSLYQAPALLLAVNTYDENLNFQVLYPDYYISSEKAFEFIEAFQKEIEQACDS